MLAVTHAQLMALQPCGPRARVVTRGMGGASKWTEPADCARLREAGATLDDLIWLADAVARADADIERRLRLWLADCAARVLHIYERTETSDAPRNAIVAARRFARGEIDAAARDAARDAAWDAAWDAARAAARGAERAAAWAAAWAAARDAAWAAARDAAWAAAWAAARDAAWAAARDAEEAWQLDRLIARMSDPEPDDYPLPKRVKMEAAQ